MSVTIEQIRTTWRGCSADRVSHHGDFICSTTTQARLHVTRAELAALDSRLPSALAKIVTANDPHSALSLLHATLDYWHHPLLACPDVRLSFDSDSAACYLGRFDAVEARLPKEEQIVFSAYLVCMEHVDGVPVATHGLEMSLPRTHTWLDTSFPGSVQRILAAETLGLDGHDQVTYAFYSTVFETPTALLTPNLTRVTKSPSLTAKFTLADICATWRGCGVVPEKTNMFWYRTVKELHTEISQEELDVVDSRLATALLYLANEDAATTVSLLKTTIDFWHSSIRLPEEIISPARTSYITSISHVLHQNHAQKSLRLYVDIAHVQHVDDVDIVIHTSQETVDKSYTWLEQHFPGGVHRLLGADALGLSAQEQTDYVFTVTSAPAFDTDLQKLGPLVQPDNSVPS